MLVENVKKRFWTAAVVVTLAATHVFPVENSRILAIEPFPAKSHWNFMSAVLRALTDGGHNVTVFTPFPEGDRENYTEADTSDGIQKIIGMDFMEMKLIWDNRLTFVPVRMKIYRPYCDRIYNDRRLTDLLADGRDDNFDAIVIEPGPPSCLMYATAGTKLPIIYTVPTSKPLFSEYQKVGDVSNPSVDSPLLARQAISKSFTQRFINTLQLLYIEALIALYDSTMFVDNPKPYDTFIPDPPSIVLTNGHFISYASLPISPTTINVGGIHLKPPQKIPKDVLEFIEGSAHGIILFTFGSTVLMSSMPNDIKTALLEALAELPQRVLLKYEGELKNKPDNVMIKNWFPQRDILVHPNIKLFVSHGGLSGVYEVLDAGIPVLGLPLFSDQYRNIDCLVEAGMAISMDILTVSKDAFFKNVVFLINDEKYSRNAKIASNLFKDRPMSPQQSVVYWTEYVIRHKGAPHLKSQAFNLTWYQYFLLDVIAFLLISIATVLFVVYRILKFVYQYSFKRYLHVNKLKPE